MSAREELIVALKDVPEPLAAEVLDFVRFLKSKASAERFELAMVSESALRKDWLRPEEEQAWRDL